MSTTGLDAATLARSLRRMAGDGSAEWVMEPIQSSVLRDIADMLDENDKLREQIERLQPKDCEGNALDIADTVSMLRSEYDGDNEWDDVVVELVLTKWGGDRWIVRGSKGEAWACDCLKTGYDEDAYEGSDDAEPIVNPSLIEVENAKLRKQSEQLFDKTLELATENSKLRELCKLCEREAENAKLREALAISVPLPLDDDCCAVHPDDVIGYNVGGTDFFGRVKEMYLTRYPKKGQPVLWVVRAVNEEGKELPHVCWGGRCRAVHKVSAQTYSPEYLETYDENEQLKAENAKLRKLALDVHALHWSGLDCTECPWIDECDTDGGCQWLGIMRDHMRDLGIEVPR